MFLALRDLRRSWSRFALVAVVVGLVAALATVLSGLATGLVSDGISGLRALPFTHMAFEPHADATFSRSTLDGTALATWRHAPGVQASPLGVSFVNAAATGHAPNIDLALFGVPADSFLVQRQDARAALSSGPGLVLSSEVRDQGVQIGDRYRLGGSSVVLPVVGFTFGGSYGHVPIAYTSLATWQQVTYGADPRGRFSAIALRLPEGTHVSALDAAAGAEVDTKAQTYHGSPGYSAETATMTLIRGFLLVISALIVGAFFTVLTVQRTRQIGLLKALGASNGYVLRDGIGQLALVVLSAVTIGTAVGAGLVTLLAGGSVPIELSARSILASAALLAAAGVAGSFFAMRRVTRVEPAIALGVEP